MPQVRIPKIIAITGFPGVGKSTLAKMLHDITEFPIISTDQFKDLGWKEQKEAALKATISCNKAIVEGVTVARLLKDGWNPDVLYVVTRDEPTKPTNAGMNAWITRGIEAYRCRGGRVIHYNSTDENLEVVTTPED